VTRNDDLWTKLVERIPIDLSRPVTYLTEDQIKRVLEGERRDLRNLVSMTSEREWAKVLQPTHSFVLPKSRTEWAVVRGKGYCKLVKPGNPEPFSSRLPIRLTTLSYGRGENPFLSHAYHSGLLDYFSRTTSKLYDTLSGRAGTRAFTFHVDGSPDLAVEQGTQMDIDKGYENTTEVLLFEAKVGAQETFLIRQLYYPLRSHLIFQQETGHKKVRPFFFVANPDKETYSLWEYEWPEDHINDYEAIQPVGEPRCFRIVEQEVPKDQFTEIPLDKSVPEIQANDLSKVTVLPFLVPQGIDTAKKWAQHYGFARRQGNYYESAAATLGLVRSEAGTFVLTEEGRKFVTLSPQQRDAFVAERLLRIPTFNRVFALAQQRDAEGVGNSEIARIIEDTRSLTGKTPPRRASTVRAWFKWLAQATGTVVVEGQRIYSRMGWEKRAK